MESTHLSGKEIVPANQDESGLQVSGETSFDEDASIKLSSD
ncbi:BnaA02g18550D [Brassica napus]|uniref:BnaA02g18550D protein n=1 Tax=Brassica napus TaxID=3708 RepID=A0A078HKG1_BRANA|nr:BnaA02g18550D [Brassica napus]